MDSGCEASSSARPVQRGFEKSLGPDPLAKLLRTAERMCSELKESGRLDPSIISELKADVSALGQYSQAKDDDLVATLAGL
jgi:hypothetical protein